MTDCDSQIADAEAEAGRARGEYERARSDFLDAFTEAVPKWWEGAVKRAVKQHPERAQKLGKEGLGALKRELAELQSQARKPVDEHLASDALWQVRDESTGYGRERFVSNPLTANEHMPPRLLDDPIRKVLGAVAPAIVSAGLADGDDWPSKAMERSKPPSYPYAMPWNEDAFATTREQLTCCAAAYKALILAERRRLDLEREKAESEAADLWDEV